MRRILFDGISTVDSDVASNLAVTLAAGDTPIKIDTIKIDAEQDVQLEPLEGHSISVTVVLGTEVNVSTPNASASMTPSRPENMLARGQIIISNRGPESCVVCVIYVPD